jgi:hypothetical protein
VKKWASECHGRDAMASSRALLLTGFGVSATLGGLACGGDDGGARNPASMAGAAGMAGTAGASVSGGGAGSAGVAGTSSSAGSGGQGGAAGTGGSGAGGGGAGGGGAAGAGGNGGSGGTTMLLGTHAKLITVDTSAAGLNTTTPVSKYPLALKLDATNFDFASATATGADLRFTKPDGTPVPHAVESFDKVAQNALVWVLIDSVPPGRTEPLLMMHWGDQQATDMGDTKKVFDMADGFVGVWHLNEPGSTTAGGYKDSSSHGAHGSGKNLNAGAKVPGILGSGTKLVHDQQQWIQIDHKDVFNQTVTGITISIWALATSFPNTYETIMSKGDTSWTLQHEGSGEKFEPCVLPTITPETPDHRCVVSKATVATNKWFHFTVVYQQPTITLYIDGQLDGTRSEGIWQTGPHPIGLGNQTQFNGNRYWDGILDEARVMTGARSADWVKLDFGTQKSEPTAVKYGPTLNKN